MATPTRLPNKTQWALTDILAHCHSSRAAWRKLFDMAEQRVDPAMALYLARIRDHIAEIERIAAAASNGEYNESNPQ